MLARLVLLESSHQKSPLRTPAVEGTVLQAPVIGENVIIISDPIEAGASNRVVTTSTVQSVRWLNDRECLFETLNSSYRIDIIDLS